MSNFIDKLSNMFAVNYDDDYDDYEDDYELDDDDDEEIEVPKTRTQARASGQGRSVSDSETSSYSRTARKDTAKHTRTSSRGGRVVPMKNNGMEVCVLKSVNYSDSTEIIDTILAGKAVIMNLEGINMDLAQRILDTVSGACYSVRGNLQKISGYIYIVTPSTVDISGDFQDILSGSYGVGSGGKIF